MSGERGFTLLEVLVAFVVATLALLVALDGFGAGIGATRRSELRTLGVLHAQSLLERFAVELPQARESRGELPDGYRWRATVERLPAAAQSRTRMVELQVEVEHAAMAPVRLATRRLEPMPSAPEARR